MGTLSPGCLCHCGSQLREHLWVTFLGLYRSDSQSGLSLSSPSSHPSAHKPSRWPAMDRVQAMQDPNPSLGLSLTLDPETTFPGHHRGRCWVTDQVWHPRPDAGGAAHAYRSVGQPRVSPSTFMELGPCEVTFANAGPGLYTVGAHNNCAPGKRKPHEFCFKG